MLSFAVLSIVFGLLLMEIDLLDALVRALPKVPGIRGRSDYFNSAVLIPLVSVGTRFHLLFQKRAANIRQPGEICFPGGKFDPALDADCQETAVRETVEELGIDRDSIEVKGRLDTMMAPMGTIVEPFLAVLKIADLKRLKPDPAEVEHVLTVPVSFFLENEPERYRVRVEIQPSYRDGEGRQHVLLPAKELQLPERYSRPWGGRLTRVLVYRNLEECIWGMTAEIVHELVKCVERSR